MGHRYLVGPGLSICSYQPDMELPGSFVVIYPEFMDIVCASPDREMTSFVSRRAVKLDVPSRWHIDRAKGRFFLHEELHQPDLLSLLQGLGFHFLLETSFVSDEVGARKRVCLQFFSARGLHTELPS
jgi:hypothetical protein